MRDIDRHVYDGARRPLGCACDGRIARWGYERKNQDVPLYEKRRGIEDQGLAFPTGSAQVYHGGNLSAESDAKAGAWDAGVCAGGVELAKERSEGALLATFNFVEDAEAAAINCGLSGRECAAPPTLRHIASRRGAIMMENRRLNRACRTARLVRFPVKGTGNTQPNSPPGTSSRYVARRQFCGLVALPSAW